MKISSLIFNGKDDRTAIDSKQEAPARQHIEKEEGQEAAASAGNSQTNVLPL